MILPALQGSRILGFSALVSRDNLATKKQTKVLTSPALAGRFYTSRATWETHHSDLSSKVPSSGKVFASYQTSSPNPTFLHAYSHSIQYFLITAFKFF